VAGLRAALSLLAALKRVIVKEKIFLKMVELVMLRALLCHFLVFSN